MTNRYETQEMSHQEVYSKRTGIALMAQIMGAVLSLSLAIGIGIWAYTLIMRDVSGVPVIAASKSPMRIAPEDPGGTSALNQGLSVNVVAEEGRVVDPDQVKLAPRPVNLMADDLTSKELQAQSNEMVMESDFLTGKLDMNALADEIVKEATSLETEGIRLENAQVEDALREAINSQLEVVPAFSGDLMVSLRPRQRPTSIKRLEATNDIAGVREIAPEDLPEGTALVQLGAFASETVARTEWVRLSKKFPSVLSDRARVIQRADRGGRTFYRLRADGFIDLNDARRFCAFLVANNSDCIPVTVR